MANFKVYPNVILGKNVTIGDYCIIGHPPKGKKPGELKTEIGDNAIIRSHTVIYAGNKIGSNFQTGHHVLIRAHNKIGRNVSIGTNSVIEHHIRIADEVRIHTSVFIPEYSELKKNCWIGPNVVFTNALHPRCPKVTECLKGPTIGAGAKVGANCTLLPHIKIGKSSLIGAGSVVTNNIKPGKLAVGNPAKEIKNIKDLKCKFKLVKKPY